MKTKLLITFIMLTVMGFSQDRPEEIVEQFFGEYQKKGAGTAIDNLYSTSQWISKKSDAIIQLKNKLEGLNEDYVGKYYGYEPIVEKKLSESYLLMSYLVKYDRQPIRFTFQFYKPDEEWVIYSFQFDSSISDEIEEAAKLYYLKLEE
ncbi:MAG: hypothetical protein K9H84_07380 [Bacteroidales bacterium]|nr:hypothetical protein [Bacteroidales bacterium]